MIPAAPDPASPPLQEISRRPAWGLLVYLAGDTEEWGQALRDDLGEILKAAGSHDLRIVVQYDGAEGAVRHIVASGPSCVPTVRQLGRIDSGSTAALLDFLQWGISVCDSERLALVLGSPLVVSPGDAERDPDRVSVFSLTHDAGSGNYLDVCDMAGTVREALKDSGRDQLDLLAIDSCRVQFLELAYELEDIVRIVIAPQTEIPAAGWDYVRILTKWKEQAALREHASTRDVATALLEDISVCYADGRNIRSVSALDLQRLDDVANAFDTMCIGTMQALGEGLIWETRKLLLETLARSFAKEPSPSDGPYATDTSKDSGDVPVYDCGSFFAMWSGALKAMAAEAYQGWLGKTLERANGTKLDRFCEAVARQIEAALVTVDRTGLTGEGRLVADRLRLLLIALRATKRTAPAKDFLNAVGFAVSRQITLLEPGASAEAARLETSAAAVREAVVKAAIEHAFKLLPRERQFDLRRMEEAADTARRLAAQADSAIRTLLGDPSNEVSGLVIANRSMPAIESGWPRWSGVSMYRPSRLDDMMNAGYTRFAFHHRVHWAALLGAANLIDQHPRALWRLVSSLLATGSAGTRRDVLRRLTGDDSVVWGLREQFQVMAPAPTMTLSLERRTRTVRQHAGGDATRENYLLRLESVTRGAVITEQESRVQPGTMEQALDELNRLLQRDVMTSQSLGDLRSIGGLLGEDIFQALGSRLEDERRAVREESPDATPHLQLQIPLELMKYPWELLHHHGEWLGERYAMGRQVFMETGLARRVPGRRQGRVRPLVIGDPLLDSGKWRQLPGARDEAEQVAGWFESNSAKPGSVIDFDRKRDTRIHCRLTRADVRALLRDGRYDIVHFAGHGLFRADDPETSAWILSDGELWSLEIRNTLADHPSPPWLVFANACEAGMDGARPNRRYHDNVFGLATAFINQGVAAYIAPLWPIDDLLAQYIALGFYRELLCERATLGEALRRAKAAARHLAYPDVVERNGNGDQAWASLGWASLVLYGDPTEELFQALAGGSHQAVSMQDAAAQRKGREDRPLNIKSPGGGPASRLTKSLAAMPVLHAPDHIVSQWVRGPNWRDSLSDQRGNGAALPEGAIALDLIEEGGLRRWRMRNGTSGNTRGAGNGNDGLPGSQIAKLLADDRVRAVLPSKRGVMRVVGRWVIGGLKDGALGLVREYDREQVKTEGLLVINGATSASLVPATRAVTNASSSRANRALVLVHGTFSKTASPVDGFGPSFVEWARQNYRVVLGFDHWTLSKSPDENAELLANELRAFDSDLLTGGRVDLVTHSRGGLVGRAFCLDHAEAVRNLIFLGTPNCGTDLANPSNWGSFADLLVNMTGIDSAELFGRMAGLLAQLAAAGVVSDVPGLLAQSPEAVLTAGSFLNKLQNSNFDHQRIRYGVVCSEFEPATLVPNLKKIVKAAADASLDKAVDALFAGANDLVVNTPYAWGIGRGPKELTSLPQFLPSKRVLVFRPPTVAGGNEFATPEGVMTEEALGIHHCNLFGQRRVQEALRTWLTEP